MNRPSNMPAQRQPIFADVLAWHMLSAEQALEWLGVIVSEWPSAAPLATCGQACRFLEQARRRRLTRHKHFGLTLQRLLVLAPLPPSYIEEATGAKFSANASNTPMHR